MLNVFGWINVVSGLFAVLAGIVVLRGVFHRPLSSSSTVRFLMWSLVASIAGLMPLTRHLTPVQKICIASVYFSAAAIGAWIRFGLQGRWRPFFALSVTAILYFDIVFVATWLFRDPPLLTASIGSPVPIFQFVQILFAASFVVLGILAAVRSQAHSNSPSFAHFRHIH